MKTYDIKKEHCEYLRDRGGSCSGQIWELELEMKIWNFIATIINFIN